MYIARHGYKQIEEKPLEFPSYFTPHKSITKDINV